jgi:hypothetical protein
MESPWMYATAKKLIKKAKKDVKSIKRFHQSGYENKRWEERDPDVIKKLIQAEKHLSDAFYLLEEITG